MSNGRVCVIVSLYAHYILWVWSDHPLPHTPPHTHTQQPHNKNRFTAKTAVHLINPPRPGKRLLVLDLDHTLLDFSDREEALQR